MKTPLRSFVKFYAIAIVLFTTNTFAQTPLPYFTGFDNASQQSGWQGFRKGDVMNSSWSYVSFNSFTAPTALSHFYPVGGVAATDDWFVSPMFDFSSGGRIDSIRHYFSGFGFPGAGDTVAIYLLNGFADPALSTKTMLFDFASVWTSDNSWHLDTNINIPPAIGPAYIAIRYRTIVNWLDVIFDNIRISGGAVGIDNNDISENDVRIYPNPTQNVLFLSNDVLVNTDITIIDLTGKVLKTISHANVNAQKQIDVSDLGSGIYFLNMVTKGNKNYMRRFSIVK